MCMCVHVCMCALCARECVSERVRVCVHANVRVCVCLLVCAACVGGDVFGGAH